MPDIFQTDLVFQAATVTGDAWMRMTVGSDLFTADDDETARAFMAAAAEAGLTVGPEDRGAFFQG